MATDLRTTDAQTVTTAIVRNGGTLRVVFSGGEQGFTVDQLDALSVAIFHARRQMNQADQDERLAFAERVSTFTPAPG